MMAIMYTGMTMHMLTDTLLEVAVASNVMCHSRELEMIMSYENQDQEMPWAMTIEAPHQEDQASLMLSEEVLLTIVLASKMIQDISGATRYSRSRQLDQHLPEDQDENTAGKQMSHENLGD